MNLNMKYYIILVISILLICFLCVFSVSHAAEFDIQYFKQLPTDGKLGDFQGVKVSGALDNSPLYLYASGEGAKFALADQALGSLSLFSGGIGLKRKVGNFTVFLDAGWYEPYSSHADKQILHITDKRYDKFWLYLNEKYAPVLGVHNFDYYQMHFRGNIGGTVGAKFNYDFKHVTVYGLIAYRLLSLDFEVEGRWNNGQYWNRREYLDLSGPVIGVGVNF